MSYPYDDEDPIILRGAPDTSTGPSGEGTDAKQVMQLDMSNEVLEELLACARNGKQAQISFGRNPVRIVFKGGTVQDPG
jgi:RNA polymerase II elongation factor ELL